MSSKDIFDIITKDELKEALKSLPVNIFLKDTEGKYIFCSNYFDKNEDIIGKTSLDTNKDKENAKKSYDIDKQIILTGKGINYIKKENINGEEHYTEVIKNPIFFLFGNVKRIAGMAWDITDRINYEEDLNILANKDDLTGLYNRTYLSFWSNNKNIKEFYPLIIFSIDCNDLKIINDKYGHIVGDQYLKYTAEILKNTFPSSSVIARTGGDEFIVIVPNSTEKQAIDYLKVLRTSAKKIKIFDSSLSIAIGFSVVNDYVNDLSKSIDVADQIMYEDKKMHKEKVKVKKLIP